MGISIHAPLRERQHPKHFTMLFIVISIHAPLRERLKVFKTWDCVITFQSTLPCGSDLRLRSPYSPQQNFNPRSLAGATLLIVKRIKFSHISIHAPLRERHTARYILKKTTGISIHAPLRERRRCVRANAKRCHFNPRSLAGATHCMTR